MAKKLTAESVAKAVAELEAAGVKPTQRAIIGITGGSFRDLGEFFKPWPDSGQAKAPGGEAELSSSGEFGRLAKDFAAKAEQHAVARATALVSATNALHEAERADLVRQRDATAEQLGDALDEAEALRTTLLQVQADNRRQAESLSSLNEELAQARMATAAADAASASTQAHARDLKQAQDGFLRQLADQNEVIDRLRRQEHEHAKELRQVNATAARSEVDAARALAEAQSNASQYRNQVEALEADLRATRQDFANLQQALLNLSEKRAKPRKTRGARVHPATTAAADGAQPTSP